MGNLQKTETDHLELELNMTMGARIRGHDGKGKGVEGSCHSGGIFLPLHMELSLSPSVRVCCKVQGAGWGFRVWGLGFRVLVVCYARLKAVLEGWDPSAPCHVCSPVPLSIWCVTGLSAIGTLSWSLRPRVEASVAFGILRAQGVPRGRSQNNKAESKRVVLVF